MAVLKKIRSRLFPEAETSGATKEPRTATVTRPPGDGSHTLATPQTSPRATAPRLVNARGADYTLHTLTDAHLDDVWRLDQRCFIDGEAYTRDTFEFLLTAPECVSYRVVTPAGSMVGFIVGLVEPGATGHVTTLGVAPEHRRHHLARRMMEKIEDGFRHRGCTSVRLEVRTVNLGAQKLYTGIGYTVTQRLPKYYSNGGDGLLMVKALS